MIDTMLILCIVLLALGWLWERGGRNLGAGPNVPLQPMHPNCDCEVCRAAKAGHQQKVPDRLLGSLPAAIEVVSRGSTPAVGVGMDVLRPSGVSRVMLLVVDGAVFESVIKPALNSHFGKAGRT